MTFDFESLHGKQERHPVLPMIPLERLRKMEPTVALDIVRQRQEIMDRMTEDPLLHGYDPPHWRLIDLMVARKRLELPGTCIQVAVLGGHDSGKTNGATVRICNHFWFTRNAWVWGLHSTEAMSVTVQQARVWTYFPWTVKGRVNRKGGLPNALDQKMKYTEGGGFTNMGFTLRWANHVPWTGKPQKLGGKFEFKVYGGQVANLQGSKLSAATSDELIDKDVARTVRQRIIPRAVETDEPWHRESVRRIEEKLSTLDADGFPVNALTAAERGLLYHGVHLMGFTPMEGYSPLVAQMLDGAALVQDREAFVDVPVDMAVPDGFPCEPLPGGKRKRVLLLPLRGEDGKVNGCARVPVFRQPTVKTDLVCYLPTNANPWTNVAGKLADMDGQSEDYIRVTWFGDVRKQWDTLFAVFDARRHVIPWHRASREGTLTVVIDPAARKPWVFGVYLTNPAGRHVKLMEWPTPTMSINGNLPGLWAVSSEHGLRNGDAGPAQKLKLNWGRAHYVHLFWQLMQRVLEKFEASGEPFKGRVEEMELTWKDRPSWSLSGKFAIPGRVLIDSRFASQHTETKGETKPLIEALYDEENPIYLEPSSGVDLSEGDTLILTELADNGLGMPGYQVVNECENTIFMYGTYAVPETSDKPTRKDDKCKDYRDTDAYFLLSGPQHVSSGDFIARSGRK